MPWGLPGILRILPSPTLVVKSHLDESLKLLPEGKKIIDLGAGGRRIRPDVETFDLFELPGVDHVGDIHNLPIDDETYDAVICTGTLEHVEDPRKAVAEMFRILKPGGMIHIDVPFIQGYHADPTDFWRFTRDGVEMLCRAFDKLECGVHIGPSCGLVWIAREWADSLSGNRIISNLLLTVMAILVWPLKFIDYFAIRSPKSHRVASAIYFRGRKPPN